MQKLITVLYKPSFNNSARFTQDKNWKGSIFYTPEDSAERGLVWYNDGGYCLNETNPWLVEELKKAFKN